MVSSWGPVLAGIFMIDLERALVTLLTAEITFRKQYVGTASLL